MWVIISHSPRWRVQKRTPLTIAPHVTCWCVIYFYIKWVTILTIPNNSNPSYICSLSVLKVISISSSSSSEPMAKAAVLADSDIPYQPKLTRPCLVKLNNPGVWLPEELFPSPSTVLLGSDYVISSFWSPTSGSPPLPPPTGTNKRKIVLTRSLSIFLRPSQHRPWREWDKANSLQWRRASPQECKRRCCD